MHALLLSALVASAPTVALWEVRSEAREETPGPVLQLEPSGTFSGAIEDLKLGLRYDPRFLFPEPGTDRRPLDLQRGSTELGWRPAAGTLLGVRQSFRYGREDFSQMTRLAADPVPSFGVTPLSRSVLLMQSITDASVRQRLSNRLDLEVSGGWQVYGGADADSRATMPISRTGTGSASLSWSALRDRASVSASASHSRVAGRDGDVFAGAAGWTHSFRPQVDMRASVGLSRASGTLQRAVLPSANLAFGVTPVPRERRFGGGVSLSMLPAVDPLTGTLVARVVGTATATLLLTKELTLSAGGGVARITSGPAASTREWQASSNVTWALGPRAAFFGGARVVSEPQRQWAAVIGFTGSHRDTF